MLIRRWLRPVFASLALLAAIGLDGCTSDQGAVSGKGGTGGSGDPGGMGGSGGTSGIGGSGGTGTGGMKVYGNTCASGLPPGTNCTQGTASVGSIVHGQGFDAYEGRTVSAAFGALTAATTVANGSFGFDFLLPNTACNLGGDSSAGGALFVDGDGDGICDPSTDLVFVWVAYGGPSGTCRGTSLTPSSPLCMLSYPGDTQALAAARNICPSIGDCFAFCGPQNTGTGGFASICAGGGRGGSGGGGQGGS